jgi:hypothetical protein
MWLPKKQQALILKNCIKGDGCDKGLSRGYSLEMKSIDLIQQMVWISWRLEILPNYREVGVIPRYTDCEIVDGYEVYTDPLTGKKSRPGYFLRLTTRDSKKLDKILNEPNTLIVDRKSKKFSHVFSSEGSSWLLSKIKKVDNVNISCTVYNIEVEGDNSYVAEGVVVHNCEHVQIPELSKGKIIDVAIREIPFTKDQEGKDLTTIYVDILIATNRKHKDIVDKISSGEYSALSMGCLIQYSICSQCGRKIEDETQACKHIRYFKHNNFYDKNGIKRVVAEICGHKDDPESCKFIDASWVRKPAFEGAVLRNILNMGDAASQDVGEKLQKAVAFPSFEYAPGMFLKAASEAAKSVVNEIEAQDEKAPAPPKDDVGFPEAPADATKPLEVDAPPAEAAPTEEAPAGETPPPDAPDSLGGKMGDPGAAPGGAPGEAPPPEPQVEEPKGDATVSEVKDMVKKQILNQIRRELLKEQATETGEQRPAELENASNSSLVKQASFQKVILASKKSGNDRLHNGLMILSSLKNWKQFKRYGYNRSDVLGLLHFVDKNASKDPMGVDAVKALSKIRLGSEGLVPFFTEIIVETGRKPRKLEARKIASWAKILSNFE